MEICNGKVYFTTEEEVLAKINELRPDLQVTRALDISIGRWYVYIKTPVSKELHELFNEYGISLSQDFEYR